MAPKAPILDNPTPTSVTGDPLAPTTAEKLAAEAELATRLAGKGAVRPAS